MSEDKGLSLYGLRLIFYFISGGSDMMKANGLFKVFTFAIVGILTGVITLAQPSWADGLKAEQDASEFSQNRHIQSTLAELAQAGNKTGACFEAGSVGKCADCCRDFMTACMDLVVSLCHRDDPNRSEFRHCIKNKEDRCKSDFGNCAWLCRRAK
jgi:hypothetical protein